VTNPNFVWSCPVFLISIMFIPHIRREMPHLDSKHGVQFRPTSFGLVLMHKPVFRKLWWGEAFRNCSKTSFELLKIWLI
jgi:hypothetical protein